LMVSPCSNCNYNGPKQKPQKIQPTNALPTKGGPESRGESRSRGFPYLLPRRKQRREQEQGMIPKSSNKEEGLYGDELAVIFAFLSHFVTLVTPLSISNIILSIIAMRYYMVSLNFLKD
jgi:hypothetical protein